MHTERKGLVDALGKDLIQEEVTTCTRGYNKVNLEIDKIKTLLIGFNTIEIGEIIIY